MHWQNTQRAILQKRKIISRSDQNDLRKLVSHGRYSEEQFEKGFQETLLYKERTGNPNAPSDTRQRKVTLLAVGKIFKGSYKKGKLSSDRIKRLEEIGFTWEILEEQFEKGFQETLLYKERTGNPNAAQTASSVIKTDEGNYSAWSIWQRLDQREGNLPRTGR